jgi:ketosteroid isomerase-like protein
LSANLDLVRSIYADWERGDFSSADWADPEIEWTAVGGPEPSSGTGVATLDAAWRDFLEAWGEYHSVAEAFRPLGIHRVLVLNRARARGRASGLIAEGGTKAANVFYIRDGKVTKLDIYWDRDRAFADLGLAPEGGMS